MDLKIIANVITIVLTAAVAGFVYGRNPGSKVTRSFMVLILSFISWAFGQIVIYRGVSAYLLLVDQSSYLAGLLIAWAFMCFVYYFPAVTIRLKREVLFIGFILTLISLPLIFLPNGIIRAIHPTSVGATFDLNFLLFSIYVTAFFYMFLYAYYILFRKLKSATGDSKFLIKYVILFSAIPVAAGGLLSMLLFYFNIYEYQIYGPVFTLVFTFGVAYLLIRSNRS